MSDDHAQRRADQAWAGVLLATAAHVAPERRDAMRNLIRAYGEARFDQGRARESVIHQQDEMNRDVERLQREFERRREQREVSR